MMSPENYRGIMQKANTLAEEIEYFIKDTDSLGNIVPIVYFEQIEDYKQKLHTAISECGIAVRNLKTAYRRDQYSEVLETLQGCLCQLIVYESKIRFGKH